MRISLVSAMVVDQFHITHVTVLETEDDPLQAIYAEGVESGVVPGGADDSAARRVSAAWTRLQDQSGRTGRDSAGWAGFRANRRDE